MLKTLLTRIAIVFYCHNFSNNPNVWILLCKFCNLGEHFSFKAPNGDLWYLTWLVIGFSVLWFFKQPNWLNSELIWMCQNVLLQITYYDASNFLFQFIAGFVKTFITFIFTSLIHIHNNTDPIVRQI